jgi:hypothetical protein
LDVLAHSIFTGTVLPISASPIGRRRDLVASERTGSPRRTRRARTGKGRETLGHFLGQRTATHAKAGKVDGTPPLGNVPIHKDTKPSKVFSASS